jgi:hypothetical protein
MALTSQNADFTLYNDSYQGGGDGNTTWVVSNSSSYYALWEAYTRPDGGIGVLSVLNTAPSSTMVYFSYNTGSFNFNTTELGNHVAMFMDCSATSKLTTLANGGGLFLIAGSSATDYVKFLIASGDDYASLGPGVKKFSFDPTKTPTGTVGSPNFSSLKIFGVYVSYAATAYYYNLRLGGIKIERPLNVTGTSTSFWGDLKTLKPNRVIQRDGRYFIQGGLTVGKINVATEVSDNSKEVIFENPKYYRSGSWYPLRADTPGITLVSAGSGSTKFTDGIEIGTDDYGKSGSVFRCIDQGAGVFDASGLATNNALLGLYDTRLRGFTGGVVIGNASSLGDHVVHTAAMEGCGTVDFGPSLVRNVEIINSSSSTAAAVMSPNSDIKDVVFIGNTGCPALQLTPYASAYSLYDVKFYGNTYDLYNSNPALITVKQYEGSNATTYSGNILLKSATDVRIEGTVSLVGAEVRIYDLNDPSGDFGTELAGVESCATSYFDFTEAPGNTVWIQILLQGYKEYGKKVLIPTELNYIFTADLQRDYNL